MFIVIMYSIYLDPETMSFSVSLENMMQKTCNRKHDNKKQRRVEVTNIDTKIVSCFLLGQGISPPLNARPQPELWIG